MDASQLLVAIMATGGGGAALLALINGIIKWVSGAATREKNRNTDLISQRREAIREREAAENDRDREAARRRKADEYASSLRRKLIENGIDPGPWYEGHDKSTKENDGQ